MTLTEAAPTTVAREAALDHLDALESQAIFIIREVAAELRNPVVLFSGGKDSVVVLHLVAKALAPAPFPFAVMHVDTGHNFQEVLDFRDLVVSKLGARLVVASVQASIDRGRCRRSRPGCVAQPPPVGVAARRDRGERVRRVLRRCPARRRQGAGEGANALVP